MTLGELMKEVGKLAELDDSASLPWTVGQLRGMVSAFAAKAPPVAILNNLIKKKEGKKP